MQTLPAFSPEETKRAKLFLATQVAGMMGRKLEEGDWSRVYSKAKGIPEGTWSNLHIDVNYKGLGVEHKLLRCGQLNGRSLKSVCGTTLMHPAATRSIRIADADAPADAVMREVFAQYATLINQRTERVRVKAEGHAPDMRTGWLLWEDNLSEFLYFEERMLPPDPARYHAEWNERSAQGVRKASKSLWIYDRATNQKRYSVTTLAGIKIQPYFDVPPPSDPNLYYFRVQGEPIDDHTVNLWVSASTARALTQKLGSLDRDIISNAIVEISKREPRSADPAVVEEDWAVSISISSAAYALLLSMWQAVSDEHRAQLLLKALG